MPLVGSQTWPFTQRTIAHASFEQAPFTHTLPSGQPPAHASLHVPFEQVWPGWHGFGSHGLSTH
jgi:hypothetical protein